MTKGVVASAPISGGPVAGPNGLWNPRTPFTILALMYVASAVMVAIFYCFPGDFAEAQSVEVRVFPFLLALALFTWQVAPRLRGTWWLEICVMVSGTGSAVATAAVPDGEGQLTIGIGLLSLGIFTAYFCSARHTLVVMVVIYTAYFAATTYNHLIVTPFLTVVLGVIIIGVSWAFASLVGRLRDQALHDGLTGLLNRHALTLLGGPVVAAARRGGSTIAVCVVDVDRFKAFNDEFGHLAGDRLLVTVADCWIRAARDSDLVVRFGGDELVLVLVGATQDAAVELEARARTAYLVAKPADWPHAWTYGSTVLLADEELDAAIDRADAQLIGRKQSR